MIVDEDSSFARELSMLCRLITVATATVYHKRGLHTHCSKTAEEVLLAASSHIGSHVCMKPASTPHNAICQARCGALLFYICTRHTSEDQHYLGQSAEAPCGSGRQMHKWSMERFSLFELRSCSRSNSRSKCNLLRLLKHEQG